ncbi:MAG: ABC transporter permease [Gammaproteobacteria bacterium]
MKRFTSIFSSGFLSEWRSIVRGLVRRPSYAVASIVMLVLALAANGVAFGVVYGLLYRPLPFAQPNRLALVMEYNAKTGRPNIPSASYRLYHTLKEHPRDIAGVGLGEHGDTSPVEINHTTHAVFYNEVTSATFSTLGTQPILGRLPSAASGKVGGPGEAVLSYGLWQSAFNSSSAAIGQTLKVHGASYRIVGVMPRHFFFPFGGIQMWITEAITPAMIQSPHFNSLVVVRLKPGVTITQFNRRLDTAVRTQMLREMTPSERSRAIKQGYTIAAGLNRSGLLAFFGGSTGAWLLQAAALFLLLLALANTINLTLVRQQARLPELATRYVLGAGRARLLSHAATEAVLLVLIAGGLAILLAWVGITGINARGIIPQFSPFYMSFGAPEIGCIVILMAIAVLCLTTASGGVARTRRLLGAVGRSPSASHARGIALMQRTLAAVQTGLACVLLIAGVLLSVSLWNLFTKALGFQPQNRVALQVFLPRTATLEAAWKQVQPALAALPEVESAAASRQIPYSSYGGDFSSISAKDGRSLHNHPAIVRAVSATSTFFRTLGVPLLHGSLYGDTGFEKKHGIIISAGLAKRLFGTKNAVGHTITEGSYRLRIVGVAQNLSWQATPQAGIAGIVYRPLNSPGYSGFMDVTARIHGNATAAITVIERTIKQTLPGSAVYQTHTMENLIRHGLAFRAVAAGLVGAFAILALILAMLGVFAVTAFIVRRRLPEYGIRAALGASPSRLLRSGLRDAARALIPGLVVGLVCAWLLERVMSSFLYHISAAVIPVFVLGVVLIAVVTFAAALAPLACAIGAPVSRLLGR